MQLLQLNPSDRSLSSSQVPPDPDDEEEVEEEVEQKAPCPTIALVISDHELDSIDRRSKSLSWSEVLEAWKRQQGWLQTTDRRLDLS